MSLFAQQFTDENRESGCLARNYSFIFAQKSNSENRRIWKIAEFEENIFGLQRNIVIGKPQWTASIARASHRVSELRWCISIWGEMLGHFGGMNKTFL